VHVKRWHHEGNAPGIGGRDEKEIELARIELNHVSSEYRHDVKKDVRIEGYSSPVGDGDRVI